MAATRFVALLTALAAIPALAQGGAGEASATPLAHPAAATATASSADQTMTVPPIGLLINFANFVAAPPLSCMLGSGQHVLPVDGTTVVVSDEAFRKAFAGADGAATTS